MSTTDEPDEPPLMSATLIPTDPEPLTVTVLLVTMTFTAGVPAFASKRMPEARALAVMLLPLIKKSEGSEPLVTTSMAKPAELVVLVVIVLLRISAERTAVELA